MRLEPPKKSSNFANRIARYILWNKVIEVEEAMEEVGIMLLGETWEHPTQRIPSKTNNTYTIMWPRIKGQNQGNIGKVCTEYSFIRLKNTTYTFEYELP